MKSLAFALLILPVLAAAQGRQQFSGAITDSMCADADHSHMRMGSTDAACTIACNSAHGAPYVLYDGKNAYTLSDQEAPAKFAGKKVTIRGALDAKTMTIHVETITEAK